MTIEVVVSEPWEFFDENDGDVAFQCSIVERRNDGVVLALQRKAKMCGFEWSYAFVTPRYVDQHISDQPSSPEPVNIHFVNIVADDISGGDIARAIGSLRSRNR